MSYKFERGKDLIIDAVVEKIMGNMKGPENELCAEFVRQFFGTVALEDLLEREIDDLSGAAINFWDLMKKRAPEELKIRIYNPDYERYGWQTTHTVVEIICKDMPFLVDSIRMVVDRLNLTAHLVVHMGGIRIMRDENHEIIRVLPKHGEIPANAEVDAPVLIEIDRQTDPEILEELYKNFESVLQDTRVVVDDWSKMRSAVAEMVEELQQIKVTVDNQEEIAETLAFLEWIKDHHFTFLGVRDYRLTDKKGETVLQSIPGTGLGVLRDDSAHESERKLSSMSLEAREVTLSPRILVLSKTSMIATVHRRAYTDYLGIKRFNKKGEVVGERRIIGLYTSAAYNTNPKHIPLLRHKVAQIMQKSLLNPRSHAGKVMLNILATLPRDDLIQASEEELLEIAAGIFQMQERRRIRMFARMDLYRRFVSCLVYVPKERVNTELRIAFADILQERLKAEEITFSIRFSESVLARIHYMIRINPQDTLDTEIDFKAIEKRMIEAGRSWGDDLREYLSEKFGEERGITLYDRYKSAFPADYMANFSPRSAMLDMHHIEELSDTAPLGMSFYHQLDEHANHFRLKIYQHDIIIPLSEVLPIVENLGLKAVTERPYRLKFTDGKITWINDFALYYPQNLEVNFDEMHALFQEAFTRIWFGEAENDAFNQLVVAAALNWREVAILRMYARYFRQIGMTFSQDYIIAALNNNPAIAKKLVELFEVTFNPEQVKTDEGKRHELVTNIRADLEQVENIDEDRIIRQYMQAISATLRTNYYQREDQHGPKKYISIKLDSKKIPGMPRPYPLYEIFVYAPKFEGVHLRGSKVARGGIRWSDRREDFRTEVLGLMKTQYVKNAIIVPGGAKGGFVVKQSAVTATREEVMAEGVACYKLFMRGLLDITDNYVNGAVVKPNNVVCYDEDDPYLVVAADKGTATFSDIANSISLEYNFWMGDAFASGGSHGYDHKKMGITARGAWESVKRHFYEMGLDINTTDFTVIGIGDMAGDVFGNGMLLSRHIKLLGAFNHAHIFIDPAPDAEVSFVERERLFNLKGSGWNDYNRELISHGGGIFSRKAKSISVSPEMKKCFNIRHDEIEPDELVKILLKAKVDLLWNGGIGTFVKAETENNIDVGDRSNDAIRINGSQLRARSVGEGGNLGFTQLARVEYALNNGRIYTDFIDNSAGVSCSDKEVNIKILLNMIEAQGDITFKQRNSLLSEMTDEVASIVLRENYLQTSAISLIESRAARSVELHSRYIDELVRTGKIDRDLENLPDEKTLTERKLLNKGLTNPEIAVLLSWSKILLKESLLATDTPEDPWLKGLLVRAVPAPLQKKFAKQLEQHPLRREIIATRLANSIVNEMGFTFIYRLQDETGAPVSAVVKAYMVVRNIFNMDEIWQKLDTLAPQISAAEQHDMLRIYLRLLRRASRSILRSSRTGFDITQTVARYRDGIDALKHIMPDLYGQEDFRKYEEARAHYQGLGACDFLAHELAIAPGLFNAMDIIEVATRLELDVAHVAEYYFGIGSLLDFAWIRNQIIIYQTDTHWEALAREALRDELDWQQRQLVSCILQLGEEPENFLERFNNWADRHKGLVTRWRNVLNELRASSSLNCTIFFVAIRELLDLTQTTIQETRVNYATADGVYRFIKAEND